MERIEKKVLIRSTPEAVWTALTNPIFMKRWMGEEAMSLEIITTWEVGEVILVRGFYHGKFENKGRVLNYVPNMLLCYTHLSSVSRLPDKPENYSVFTFYLTHLQNQVVLSLTLENFPTETIFKHLEFYWNTTLLVLKDFIERQ